MGFIRSLVGVTLFLSLVLFPSPTNSTEVEKKPLPERPPPPLPSPSPSPGCNVAVEGVIYGRSSRLPGYVKAVDGAPLPGVAVLLRCGRYAPTAVKGTTDSRGYFYLQTTLKSKYLARSCKVFVLSSPAASCSVPPEYGLKGAGASVMFEKKLTEGYSSVVLYSAGFLVLGPPKSS